MVKSGKIHLQESKIIENIKKKSSINQQAENSLDSSRFSAQSQAKREKMDTKVLENEKIFESREIIDFSDLLE